MNRLRAPMLLAAWLVLAAPVFAAERVVVSLPDPAGDDRGAGSLVLPASTGLDAGDLDLRAIDISVDDVGFWFSVTMDRFIRARSVDGNDLPFGFNLDLYLDTDRREGSGNQFTLPGRKLRIDRRYAWERAVVLTPQPTRVRQALIDTLRKNFPDRPPGEAEASIDASMYFVPNFKIRNKTITFQVPHKVIGTADASDWAAVALVTAATTQVDGVNLGVWGGEVADVATVYDALLPNEEAQTVALGGQRPLTGLSWGRSTASELALAPVPVEPPAPRESATRMTRQDESLLGGAIQGIRELLSGTAETTRPLNAPAWRPGQTPTPIGAFLDAAPPADPASVSSAALLSPGAALVGGPGQSVAERLKVLKTYRDQGLVDDSAYRAARKRILDEL